MGHFTWLCWENIGPLCCRLGPGCAPWVLARTFGLVCVLLVSGCCGRSGSAALRFWTDPNNPNHLVFLKNICKYVLSKLVYFVNVVFEVQRRIWACHCNWKKKHVLVLVVVFVVKSEVL